MKLHVLILLVPSCFASKQFCPNCYKINEKCHNLAYLFDLPGPDFGRTLKVGIIKTINILVFSFYTKARNSEVAQTGYIKLDNPAINGIINAGKNMHFQSFDIDQENELIYLGAADGIFVLSKDQTLSLVGANNSSSIIDLAYIKNTVYYVTADDQRRTINGVPINNIRVTNLIVTNNESTVFLGNSDKMRLYITKGKETGVISESFHKGLAKDIYGNIYSWTDEGIYKIEVANDLNESTVVKILDIEKVEGLAFDSSNNIIFNVGRAIFKLSQTNSVICTKTTFVHCSAS